MRAHIAKNCEDKAARECERALTSVVCDYVLKVFLAPGTEQVCVCVCVCKSERERETVIEAAVHAIVCLSNRKGHLGCCIDERVLF